jgi:hypothetical protein
MIFLTASPSLNVEGSTPHSACIVPHFWDLTCWVWQFSRAGQGDAEYHSYHDVTATTNHRDQRYWHLTRTLGHEIDTPISDQQSDHTHGTGIQADSHDEHQGHNPTDSSFSPEQLPSFGHKPRYGRILRCIGPSSRSVRL